jgi:hypothetical protein
MVVGLVGQTLRLFNDDSGEHQPHTAGAQFPHAALAIQPGAFVDFVLTQELDPGQLVHSPVYDHLYGQTAEFWIKVTRA